MPTSKKEKFVEEYKRWSCLLPGHRLNKCDTRNRCKVEGCDIRHHTLVHEFDLNIIERARARKVEKLTEGERVQESTIAEAGKKPPNQTEEPREHWVSSLSVFRLRNWRSCVGWAATCSWIFTKRKERNKCWHYVTRGVTQHLWTKDWLCHLVLKARRSENCKFKMLILKRRLFHNT